MTTDFTFTDWLKASGLNDRTKSVLEKEDLDTDRAILTFSDTDLNHQPRTVRWAAWSAALGTARTRLNHSLRFGSCDTENFSQRQGA